MKIFHLTQVIFMAVGKERCGGNRTFDICFAETREQAERFARKRLWKESALIKYQEETIQSDGGKIESGPLKSIDRTDLPAFIRVLEFKVGELLACGKTHVSGGNWLYLREVDTNHIVDNPEEIAIGQPLPVREKDLNGDFYSIWTDRQGVKQIHINGYFYDNEDHWSHVEAVGIMIPLKEFINEYASRGQEYVDELFESAKQYQDDFDTLDEACNCYRRYFDGCPPEARIPYSSLTKDFPDGDYVS